MEVTDGKTNMLFIFRMIESKCWVGCFLKIKCWIVVESRKEAMLVQRVGWVTDPEFYRA